MILNIEVGLFLNALAPNELFFIFYGQECTQYTRDTLPDHFLCCEATVKKLQFGYLIAIHN